MSRAITRKRVGMGKQGRFAVLVSLPVAASLLGGCGSSLADVSGGTAQVRFVAVAPGTPAVDFYMNGTGAAYGLGYESFTSYLPVGSGQSTLAVHRTGAGQAFVTAQDTLASGRQYTVLLGHTAAGVQATLYPDQDAPAPAGEVALRVLNGVEGGSPVSFYVAPVGAAAPPVAAFTLGPGTASGYHTLPAGAYVITATAPSGALRIPVSSLTLKAKSGAVRTVVFAGPLNVENREIVAFPLADADMP